MFRMILFLAALSAGGAAAWLAVSLQSVPPAPATVAADPASPAMQQILVASSTMETGDRLGEASLNWLDWPEQSISSSFISRSARPDAMQELDGLVVRQGFVAGEPIREDKLNQSSSSLLSTLLPSGRRAVAIRISAENTAGGFILPNDRVDVLHTTSESGDSGSANSLTRTVIRNVRVLAIDQNAKENGSESVVGRTATLDLDPKQVEIITAAQATGLISLALRSVEDNAEASITSESQRRTVRVFRGGKPSIVTIQ